MGVFRCYVLVWFSTHMAGIVSGCWFLSDCVSRLFVPLFFIFRSDTVLTAALFIPRFFDVHWTLTVPLAHFTQVPCSSIVRNRLNCPRKAMMFREIRYCQEFI